jgi:hypothetical protein
MRVQFLAGADVFLCSIQTHSEAHQTFCPVSTGGPFIREQVSKVWNWSLHLIPKLRMWGAISPLPNASSCHDTYKVTYFYTLHFLQNLKTDRASIDIYLHMFLNTWWPTAFIMIIIIIYCSAELCYLLPVAIMVMIYTTFRFLRFHAYESLIECLKHLYHFSGIGVTIQSQIKIAVIAFLVCVGIPHKIVIYAN